MKKDIKICPITKFIVWCILGLLICLIGITNVFADTYSSSQFSAQLYDNYGPNLSAVTTDQTNGRWQGTIPSMTANSSGAAWGISSPVILIANHTYSLTAKISGTYGGNIRTSTYNRIGVGTSLANAITSYQNNTNVTENYSGTTNTGDTIQFAFTPTINGNFIVFAFATTSGGSNWSFYLYDIVIDDLGASGGVSQSDINNSLNSQTTILNQSITNSQNAITNNSDTNRDLIIDSQEDMRDAIIQNQNENQEQTNNLLGTQCSNLFNSPIVQGSISSSGSDGGSDYRIKSQNIIYLDAGTYTINASGSLNINYHLYNTSGVWQSIGSSTWLDLPLTFTLNERKGIRFVFKKIDNTVISPSDISNIMLVSGSSPKTYCEYGSFSSKLDEQTDAINGINDSLTDDNVDSSSWANFFNNFTTNTFGLTSIVTAPLNLIQSLTNTTCTDLQLPLPYLTNKYLTLPCMSTIYSQYFGSFFTLYQTITYGIIAYWVCVRVFNLVKDFKNPDHDEIEVVDL